MFTFYFAPGTCALASHIALEHAGAPYEAVRVDFAHSEQRSPDYLRLNPKGRVPALVTGRGILTETPAILQFICQSFPQAGLAPLDDVFELAQMNAFNSYLCSTVHVAHAHGRRGHRWADDPAAIAAMQKKVPQTMGDCFELIERDYFKGPWVLGERYTVSDMYLFTISQWLKGDGVDVKRYPKVDAHTQRMAADPVVSKVLAAQNAA
ncbi:MAG: glutathione S-transferase family protein [Rhizobacter sp.]